MVEQKEKDLKESELRELKEEKVSEMLFNEIKTGKRIIEVEGYGEFELRFPTADDNRKADWYYSKVWNQAFSDGLPTLDELLESLEKRGVWGEKQEEEVTQLNNDITQLETILAKRDKKDRSKATIKIAKELVNKRNKLYLLQLKKQQYLSHCVESKAEEARKAYLISRCVFKDGKLFWNSLDEYENDKRFDLLTKIQIEFLTFQAGISSDFLEKLPESEFIDTGNDE